jgi:hypothetical protein
MSATFRFLCFVWQTSAGRFAIGPEINISLPLEMEEK